jgi:hypothetical protein
LFNLRRFPRKCHGCSQLLNPNELIMRARHLVFHMNCFKCLLCDRQLNTGDEFGIGKDNSLFCRVHYYFHLQQQPATHQQDKFDYYSIKSESYVNNYDSQQTMCNLPPTPGMSPNNLNPINSVSPTLNQCNINNINNNTNIATTNNSNQNQKGRPKKRKLPNNESSASNKKSANKSNKQQSAENNSNSLEVNNPNANNSKLNNTTISVNQTTLSSNQSASNPSETNGSSQTKSKHETVSSSTSSSATTNTTVTSHSLIANVESPDEFQSTNVNSKNFDNNLGRF